MRASLWCVWLFGFLAITCRPAYPRGCYEGCLEDTVCDERTLFCVAATAEHDGGVGTHNDDAGIAMLNTDAGVAINTDAGVSTESDDAGTTPLLEAPSGLRYMFNPAVYPLGESVQPNPLTSTGGPISSYSIAPPLPIGLSFDVRSGEIAGAPTLAPGGDSEHVVTATNDSGSATVTLRVKVIDWEWSRWQPPAIDTRSAQFVAFADVVEDQLTGLIWQRRPPPDLFLKSETDAYCQALSLAGKDDWRVPTSVELLSIVAYTQHNPAINSSVFPDTPAAYFWTSSQSIDFSPNFFMVHFQNGQCLAWSLPQKTFVRCVRGGIQ